MKYDWEKIIKDQADSELSIEKYCKHNSICVSSFYKFKKRLYGHSESKNGFSSVKVIEKSHSDISMNIDGHSIQFDAAILEQVIGALK